MRMLKLAAMLLRETVTSKHLERRPEPTELMDDVDQVLAFHEAGQSELIPIYHFNATSISRLTPVGATVLDLGSGSGRFLAYLAECRPDLRIIGIELAPKMVAIGRRFLSARGLADRVELQEGDMTNFASAMSAPVHLISSVFSLHHLPSLDMLQICLAEIGTARMRDDAAIWIFDHARPKHPETPTMFPEIFTPRAPASFNEDSRNSLTAAFTFSEMRRAMGAAGIDQGDHWLARWLPLYQVHTWRGRGVSVPLPRWCGPKLLGRALADLNGLRALFPELRSDDY